MSARYEQWGRAGLGACALAMVATPLARRGGRTRRRLTSAVIGGLFLSTTARATAQYGARRASAAAGAVVGTTTLVEWLGTRAGFPFGRYAYTPALRHQVGGVPVVVPMAWWAMAVPALEVARAGRSGRLVYTDLGAQDRARRVGVAAAALTAWDLFLDPQMVAEGYWRWERGGRYRGIPLVNFAGWYLTSVVVMVLLELVLQRDDRRLDPDLVGTYMLMAVMETIGFAAFFRDRRVALAGGAAMLPFALQAARRLAVDRHWRSPVRR